MPAYFIAELEVTDAALYEAYRLLVSPTIAAYGGRLLVRSNTTTLLEGERAPGLTVVLEFPDMARLLGWYHSPEYAPLIVMRQQASRGTLRAMEGVAP